MRWSMKAVAAMLCLLSFDVAADVTAPSPRVAWLRDAKVASEKARTTRRPLLVFFTAEWCMPCKEMQKKSFADPAVEAMVSRFVPLLVDATDGDDPVVEALRKELKVATLPAVVVRDGKRDVLVITTYLDGPELAERLRAGLKMVGRD